MIHSGYFSTWVLEQVLSLRHSLSPHFSTSQSIYLSDNLLGDAQSGAIAALASLVTKQ
jgi:hypothetical protein